MLLLMQGETILTNNQNLISLVFKPVLGCFKKNHSI